MMEFSSDFSAFLINLEDEPALVVIWAALLFPFSLLFILILSSVLKKLQLDKPFEQIGYISTVTILMTWLTGFISQMMLLFIGISGIRMLLIWLVMFITCLFFSIFNYQKLILYLKIKEKEQDDKLEQYQA